MSCCLSTEFLIAAKTFQLSRQDLLNIAMDSFSAGFIHKTLGSGEDIWKVMQNFKKFACVENLKLCTLGTLE